MVTKIGKITLAGILVTIGAYLWKISLIILIVALIVGMYFRHKALNRSKKWD